MTNMMKRKWEAWKAETKPKLDRYLKEENTVLLAEDEMVLTTETTIQKSGFQKENFKDYLYDRRKKEKKVSTDFSI